MDPPHFTRAPLGDYALHAASLYLVYSLRGPAAVTASCALFTHLFLVGRRRISLVPLYASIILASYLTLAYARTSQGALSARAQWLLRGAVLASTAVGAALDAWVFPLDRRSPVRAMGALACRGVAQTSLGVSAGGGAFTLRVYYPAAVGAQATRVPYCVEGLELAAGIARFMKLPTAVFGWMRHLRGWSVVADAVDAPLDFARARAAAVAASLIPAAATRLPVVVFSHGLSGSPDLNAAIIAAYVAAGAVVLAPEHADGSGAFTRVTVRGSGAGALTYEPLTREERGSRDLEYVRRHRQLRQRADELVAAVRVAADLAALRVAAPDAGLPSPNASDAWPLLAHVLGGRINGSAMLASGHSFGGATAITAAESEPLISAVVSFDPWAFPLSAATLSRGLPRVPVLGLVGEGFAIWRENATAMRLLLSPTYRTKRVLTGDAPPAVTRSNGIEKSGQRAAGMGTRAGVRGVHAASAYVALRDVYHQSFSDFGLLAPPIMRALKYIGSTRSARDEVVLINEIALDFWAHACGAGSRGAPFVALAGRGDAVNGELMDTDKIPDFDPLPGE